MALVSLVYYLDGPCITLRLAAGEATVECKLLADIFLVATGDRMLLSAPVISVLKWERGTSMEPLWGQRLSMEPCWISLSYPENTW